MNKAGFAELGISFDLLPPMSHLPLERLQVMAAADLLEENGEDYASSLFREAVLGYPEDSSFWLVKQGVSWWPPFATDGLPRPESDLPADGFHSFPVLLGKEARELTGRGEGRYVCCPRKQTDDLYSTPPICSLGYHAVGKHVQILVISRGFALPPALFGLKARLIVATHDRDCPMADKGRFEKERERLPGR